ncbi:DarT ssDNA thymidine ADP-ribosyltransferase family protein [Frondihabitans cladoniiphilus]|uniref:DarT ssDNA thymidine ADP-ribosyltransferase family protein n=1 Tax=Frondihabitans cladoniiphilus TaxID=715785 RepID=UPI0031EC7F80
MDIEHCDICNPRVREPQPAAVSRAPRIPRTSPRKAQAPRLRDSGPATSAASGPDLISLRAHHWTHVSNLPSILASGALQAGATPELDVSTPALRESRAQATVAGAEHGDFGGEPTSVASFVPLALTPSSAAWAEVRAGAEEDRWSDAARETRATDYVVLVFPVAALGTEFVVTDGDATGATTRSGAGIEAGGSLVRRASLTDPDLVEVELLVPDSVDLASATLIGVANDKARDRVKELIKAAKGASPRVAIYPPWFRPAED